MSPVQGKFEFKLQLKRTVVSRETRTKQVTELLAMPLPRRVPADLLRAAQRQQAPVALAVIGGLFLALGVLLAGVLFPWNFHRDWRLQAPDTAEAPGRVLTVADTDLTINKRRVVRYEFSFEPAAGGTVRGVGFTTGLRWREGAAVPVRYRPEDPTVCCLAGARSSEGEDAGLVMPLFPLLGLTFLVWHQVTRRRIRRLLEQGLLAEAVITNVEETGSRTGRGRRYVHLITLRRTDSPDGGGFRLKTDQPEVIDFAQQRKEAQQPVFVLYDPDRPKTAILPETL